MKLENKPFAVLSKFKCSPVYAFFDSLKATLMTLAVASTCPIDLVTPTFKR